jgi:hypothetical protein
MADHVKFPPAKLVGERNAIGCDFADRECACDVARMAVTADINEGVRVKVAVERIEHRGKYPMIPKPPVDDQNFRGTVADRRMPNHSGSLPG